MKKKNKILSSIKNSKVVDFEFNVSNSKSVIPALKLGIEGNLHLKSLFLPGCGFNEEFLKSLITTLQNSNISTLDLSGNPAVSKALCFMLISSCKNLETLYLRNCNLKADLQNLAWGLEKSSIKNLFIDENKLHKLFCMLGPGIAKSKVTRLSAKSTRIELKDLQEFFVQAKSSSIPLRFLDISKNEDISEIPSHFVIPSGLRIKHNDFT